jgi:hypothetical protein
MATEISTTYPQISLVVTRLGDTKLGDPQVILGAKTASKPSTSESNGPTSRVIVVDGTSYKSARASMIAVYGEEIGKVVRNRPQIEAYHKEHGHVVEAGIAA